LSRFGGAEGLRQRIADARRFNPYTIMPPYLSTEGLQEVAAAYRGQTVLTPQGLDDIVAYLMLMAR
jgi:sulfur-oxidizing protein SoxX